MAVGYNPRVVTDGLVLALDAANPKSYNSGVFGQQTYTSSGTYSWTCPSGVTSVSVVCIGGGGGGNGGGNGVGGAGGGGGGGLGYKNNISVTPGQSYTVVVGGGGAGDYWNGPPYSTDPANSGGDSYFIDATTVKGGGGGGGNGNSAAAGGSGGTYVGDGGGNGYSGGTGSSGSSSNGYLPATGGGGGSTGTYTGNATTRGTSKYITSNCTSGCFAGSGTGQGLLGTGDSGFYGRGGGANMNTFSNGASGYTGAVRIMWGPGRSYPSTGVADQSSSIALTDVSGKSNNGTLINGPTYSSDNGGSFEFDGSDDYVDVGSTNIPAGPLTVSAWINLSSEVSIATIAASNGDWIFGTTSRKPFAYNYASAAQTTAPSGDALSIGVWYNVVMVQGSSLDVYINGSLSATNSDGTDMTATEDLDIGRRPGNNDRYHHGKIADLKIYSKALTAAEVLQNFNALRGRYGI